jgi:hypothetical protein
VVTVNSFFAYSFGLLKSIKYANTISYNSKPTFCNRTLLATISREVIF